MGVEVEGGVGGTVWLLLEEKEEEEIRKVWPPFLRKQVPSAKRAVL